MTVQDVTELKSVFADEQYLLQRRSPKYGEMYYLHLVDLLSALKKMETSEKLKILDYGAGNSPYRFLFPNSDYRRADLDNGENNLDYIIQENGSVPEKSQEFDLVLSTQVLEHVSDHESYLLECFRLLKPGGKLLISTHGLFEEHGRPYDFKRWTADGLKVDLEKAGFEIISIEKLTTGLRAVMFFLDRYYDDYFDVLYGSSKTLARLRYWIGTRIFRRFRKFVHLLLDRYYSEYKVVPSEAKEPHHNIYVALLACAYRPR